MAYRVYFELISLEVGSHLVGHLSCYVGVLYILIKTSSLLFTHRLFMNDKPLCKLLLKNHSAPFFYFQMKHIV